jgi:hypothetical protein
LYICPNQTFKIMRKFRFLIALIVVLLIGIGSAFSFSANANIEGFRTLSKQLEEAVDSRDFHKAREVVDEILPLMKEDIKVSKSELKTLKKSDDPSYEAYQTKYDRKVELHDSVEHLINLSAAALRGKSKLIVSEVEEFISLMEETTTDS